MKREKAILVVSFGTSYEETRRRTIEAVEKSAAQAYPDWAVYRAWTSGMIIRKVRERDGLSVDTVTEAMERMAADGIRKVLVQPTHVINGIENEQMVRDAKGFQDRFEEIRFGTPLLTSDEDCARVIEALMERRGPVGDDTALVFIGHGTTHYANAVYAALDYRMKDMGYPNVFLGTVEAYPSLETLKRRLREGGFQRAELAPFMIVAGDHAHHDMASDEEDSWRYQLEREGYETVCHMEGLGEYPGIRKILMDHIRDGLSGEAG